MESLNYRYQKKLKEIELLEEEISSLQEYLEKKRKETKELEENSKIDLIEKVIKPIIFDL